VNADGRSLACDNIYIYHSDTVTMQMITVCNMPLGLEIVKTTVFIRILISVGYMCTCAYDKTTSSNVLGRVYAHTHTS